MNKNRLFTTTKLGSQNQIF